jgi:hypothetical protein
MIWNIEKAKCVNRFMDRNPRAPVDHEHFVQGASWDPRNKYTDLPKIRKFLK